MVGIIVIALLAFLIFALFAFSIKKEIDAYDMAKAYHEIAEKAHKVANDDLWKCERICYELSQKNKELEEENNQIKKNNR